MRKKLIATLVLLFIVTAVGAGCLLRTSENNESVKPDAPAKLIVHFISVGQADSILVQFPNGQTALVDGGNNGDEVAVLAYLNGLGIRRLDYVIATHPHADHVGGLDRIVENLDIGAVYAPQALSTTKTFLDFLRAVDAKELNITPAESGVALPVGDGITAVFIAPISKEYADLNNASAVLHIRYRNTAFLLAGDAEAESEREMLAASGSDLRADVLKVGHHGSKSSTSRDFLTAVSPAWAIIAVGAENDYGLPDEDIIDRLAKAGAAVYRTDRHGTVVVESDGKAVTVRTEKDGG